MLIILDRDGVINFDSPNYITSPTEWQAIPGSLNAIIKLQKANYNVVVATNQSGVGRNYYSLETLDKIHKKMNREIIQLGGKALKIYFCPHVPEDNCACRKPKPGLFLQIKQDFPEHFSQAIAVGDSARDIAAAHAAGCQAVLVRSGNGPKTLTQLEIKIPVYEDLAEFVGNLFK